MLRKVPLARSAGLMVEDYGTELAGVGFKDCVQAPEWLHRRGDLVVGWWWLTPAHHLRGAARDVLLKQTYLPNPGWSMRWLESLPLGAKLRAIQAIKHSLKEGHRAVKLIRKGVRSQGGSLALRQVVI